LMPKEETKAAPSNNAQPQGAIPEGTVIGDGHIKYVLARIDSRLLHGQVATGWTKAMNPNRIIVVSDNVAKDKIRKTMIKEAAPAGVPANVVPINKMLEVRSEEHTSELKSRFDLVCRLLLEKKNTNKQ